MAATKKITIEVEVPEGLDEGLFREEAQRQLARIALLMALEKWGKQLEERELTPEEEELLKEIKKGVARRAEKGMKK